MKHVLQHLLHIPSNRKTTADYSVVYTYGFKSTELEQATTFLHGFLDYPTRNHPKWLNLVASANAPNLDCDGVWLEKAGYGDMASFMKFYGLQGEEAKVPATKLLARFRDRHQRLWRDEVAAVAAGQLSQWVALRNDPLISTAIEPASGGFKMTSTQIAEAVRVHEAQDHMPYYDLKKLVQDNVIHGLPDFIGSMLVANIPICDHCTKLGMKDR